MIYRATISAGIASLRLASLSSHVVVRFLSTVPGTVTISREVTAIPETIRRLVLVTSVESPVEALDIFAKNIRFDFTTSGGSSGQILIDLFFLDTPAAALAASTPIDQSAALAPLLTELQSIRTLLARLSGDATLSLS